MLKIQLCITGINLHFFFTNIFKKKTVILNCNDISVVTVVLIK